MKTKEVSIVTHTEHLPEVGDVIRFGTWVFTPFINKHGNTMMRVTHDVTGNAIEMWDGSSGWFRLGDGGLCSRDVYSSEYEKHQDR